MPALLTAQFISPNVDSAASTILLQVSVSISITVTDLQLPNRGHTTAADVHFPCLWASHVNGDVDEVWPNNTVSARLNDFLLEGCDVSRRLGVADVMEHQIGAIAATL